MDAPRAFALAPGTDLRRPPPNYLQRLLPDGSAAPPEMVAPRRVAASGHLPDASLFAVTSDDEGDATASGNPALLSLADYIGSVDFVASSRDMARLFALPFHADPVSMLLHRVADTLVLEATDAASLVAARTALRVGLLDDFHVPLSRLVHRGAGAAEDDGDAGATNLGVPWRTRAPLSLLAPDVSAGGRTGSDDWKARELISKFLYRSVLSPDGSDASGHGAAETPPHAPRLQVQVGPPDAGDEPLQGRYNQDAGGLVPAAAADAAAPTSSGVVDGGDAVAAAGSVASASSASSAPSWTSVVLDRRFVMAVSMPPAVGSGVAATGAASAPTATVLVSPAYIESRVDVLSALGHAAAGDAQAAAAAAAAAASVHTVGSASALGSGGATPAPPSSPSRPRAAAGAASAPASPARCVGGSATAAAFDAQSAGDRTIGVGAGVGVAAQAAPTDPRPAAARIASPLSWADRAAAGARAGTRAVAPPPSPQRFSPAPTAVAAAPPAPGGVSGLSASPHGRDAAARATAGGSAMTAASGGLGDVAPLAQRSPALAVAVLAAVPRAGAAPAATSAAAPPPALRRTRGAGHAVAGNDASGAISPVHSPVALARSPPASRSGPASGSAARGRGLAAPTVVAPGDGLPLAPPPTPLMQIARELAAAGAAHTAVSAAAPPTHSPRRPAAPATPSPPPPSFRRALYWDLHGATMVLGSDSLLFRHSLPRPPARDAAARASAGAPPARARGSEAAEAAATAAGDGSADRLVSLHLRPAAHSFSTSEILELYLENRLGGVDDLAVCYTTPDGIVAGYEMIATEDVPSKCSPPMTATRIERDARALLRFLRDATAPPGGAAAGAAAAALPHGGAAPVETATAPPPASFWLFRPRGDTTVRLLHLTAAEADAVRGETAAAAAAAEGAAAPAAPASSTLHTAAAPSGGAVDHGADARTASSLRLRLAGLCYAFARNVGAGAEDTRTRSASGASSPSSSEDIASDEADPLAPPAARGHASAELALPMPRLLTTEAAAAAQRVAADALQRRARSPSAASALRRRLLQQGSALLLDVCADSGGDAAGAKDHDDGDVRLVRAPAASGGGDSDSDGDNSDSSAVAATTVLAGRSGGSGGGHRRRRGRHGDARRVAPPRAGADASAGRSAAAPTREGARVATVAPGVAPTASQLPASAVAASATDHSSASAVASRASALLAEVSAALAEAFLDDASLPTDVTAADGSDVVAEAAAAALRAANSAARAAIQGICAASAAPSAGPTAGSVGGGSAATTDGTVGDGVVSRLRRALGAATAALVAAAPPAASGGGGAATAAVAATSPALPRAPNAAAGVMAASPMRLVAECVGVLADVSRTRHGDAASAADDGAILADVDALDAAVLAAAAGDAAMAALHAAPPQPASPASEARTGRNSAGDTDADDVLRLLCASPVWAWLCRVARVADDGGARAASRGDGAVSPSAQASPSMLRTLGVASMGDTPPTVLLAAPAPPARGCGAASSTSARPRADGASTRTPARTGSDRDTERARAIALASIAVAAYEGAAALAGAGLRDAKSPVAPLRRRVTAAAADAAATRRRLGDALNTLGQLHLLSPPPLSAPETGDGVGVAVGAPAAIACFSRAVDRFSECGDTENATLARLNVAHVMRALGHAAAAAAVGTAADSTPGSGAAAGIGIFDDVVGTATVVARAPASSAPSSAPIQPGPLPTASQLPVVYAGRLVRCARFRLPPAALPLLAKAVAVSRDAVRHASGGGAGHSTGANDDAAFAAPTPSAVARRALDSLGASCVLLAAALSRAVVCTAETPPLAGGEAPPPPADGGASSSAPAMVGVDAVAALLAEGRGAYAAAGDGAHAAAADAQLALHYRRLSALVADAASNVSPQQGDFAVALDGLSLAAATLAAARSAHSAYASSADAAPAVARHAMLLCAEVAAGAITDAGAAGGSRGACCAPAVRGSVTSCDTAAARACAARSALGEYVALARAATSVGEADTESDAAAVALLCRLAKAALTEARGASAAGAPAAGGSARSVDGGGGGGAGHAPDCPDDPARVRATTTSTVSQLTRAYRAALAAASEGAAPPRRASPAAGGARGALADVAAELMGSVGVHPLS